MASLAFSDVFQFHCRESNSDCTFCSLFVSRERQIIFCYANEIKKNVTYQIRNKLAIVPRGAIKERRVVS